MFDNLLKLVQEHAGEAIVNNPAIPNENNNAAIQVASNGIVNHLQNLASNGGIEKVIGLFNNSESKGQEVNAISNNVTEKLMKQFGIDNAAASSIVQNLIPKVMDQFVNKTNDANDNSFDLQNIISSLTGGNQAGGLIDKLKGMF